MGLFKALNGPRQIKEIEFSARMHKSGRWEVWGRRAQGYLSFLLCIRDRIATGHSAQSGHKEVQRAARRWLATLAKRMAQFWPGVCFYPSGTLMHSFNSPLHSHVLSSVSLPPPSFSPLSALPPPTLSIPNRCNKPR